MTGFAAELPVRGRRVLVTGGGDAMLGRIAALRDAGADLHVVAPSVTASVADLAERDLLRWEPRPATAADVGGAWLVVLAGADPVADAIVRAVADRLRVFCLAPAESAAPAAPLAPAESAAPAVPAAGAEAAAPLESAAPAVPAAPADPAAPPDAADPVVTGHRTIGTGRVTLVGGGPGDPGLITVAGLTAIRTADVVVTDRLAPLAVLRETRPGTEIVDVGKIPRGRFTPQERINQLLVEHARAGRNVVRLKGGDNFVFGRGGEEWQACAQAGIEVRVVPGVSSAIAVPALAGIPLTHRTANQGFTVITAHVPPGDPRSTLDYAALARSGTALVIMMGVATLGAVAAELIRHGLDPATPAATVADGGLPDQKIVRGTLVSIADAIHDAGIRPPAITIIGSVAAFDPAAGPGDGCGPPVG